MLGARRLVLSHQVGLGHTGKLEQEVHLQAVAWQVPHRVLAYAVRGTSMLINMLLLYITNVPRSCAYMNLVPSPDLHQNSKEVYLLPAADIAATRICTTQ